MSDTPNPSTNDTNIELISSESINNLFSEVFDTDVYLPDWASAPAKGKLCPSAQLRTRDGRWTGNAVLMWWTIVSGMPAAVVSTDAGNVMILTQAELEEMFYAPEFLMRDPLYAHLAGIAAASIEIPDEYRFLFNGRGVPLDDDDEAVDDFETYVEGPNPLIVGLMETIMGNLAEPEVTEERTDNPFEGIDLGDDGSFGIMVTDRDGNTVTTSFDTVEDLNKFMTQMYIPFQV